MEGYRKRGIAVIVFIMLMGLGFIVSYVVTRAQYAALIADYEMCEAVVTETAPDFHPYNAAGLEDVYVVYTVDGTEYRRELSTNTGLSFGKVITNFEPGDRVTIYYNPENPAEIATPESNKTGLFAAGFGLVAFVFGATLFIIVIRNNRKGKTNSIP